MGDFGETKTVSLDSLKTNNSKMITPMQATLALVALIGGIFVGRFINRINHEVRVREKIDAIEKLTKDRE